jgi:hypothetical protein
MLVCLVCVFFYSFVFLNRDKKLWSGIAHIVQGNFLTEGAWYIMNKLISILYQEIRWNVQNAIDLSLI